MIRCMLLFVLDFFGVVCVAMFIVFASSVAFVNNIVLQRKLLRACFSLTQSLADRLSTFPWILLPFYPLLHVGMTVF